MGIETTFRCDSAGCKRSYTAHGMGSPQAWVRAKERGWIRVADCGCFMCLEHAPDHECKTVTVAAPADVTKETP